MKYWKTGAMTLALCASLVGASTAADEKAPPEPLAQYLERMQTQLEHTARRVNQPTSEGSSVVGLRGSKQEPAAKQLYWKGKKKSSAASPDELKAFRAAIEQAREGKKAEAVTGLKSFQEKYPASALLPDVQETLKRLSE